MEVRESTTGASLLFLPHGSQSAVTDRAISSTLIFLLYSEVIRNSVCLMEHSWRHQQQNSLSLSKFSEWLWCCKHQASGKANQANWIILIGVPDGNRITSHRKTQLFMKWGQKVITLIT